MYVPAHFRESDPERLFALVERYDFAALITVTPEGPFVSHVPFLLDRARGPHGTLVAHLARANPQWKHFASNPDVLVVFQGPHAYVSPSWYEPRPGNVPTWNYAAVHARGPATLTPEGEPTLAVLQRLTATHEKRIGGSYAVAPDDHAVAQLSRGVVAFEVAITELTGKLKMSQNRTDGDRASVRAHLAASGDPLERDVATTMGELEERR